MSRPNLQHQSLYNSYIILLELLQIISVHVFLPKLISVKLSLKVFGLPGNFGQAEADPPPRPQRRGIGSGGARLGRRAFRLTTPPDS